MGCNVNESVMAGSRGVPQWWHLQADLGSRRQLLILYQYTTQTYTWDHPSGVPPNQPPTHPGMHAHTHLRSQLPHRMWFGLGRVRCMSTSTRPVQQQQGAGGEVRGAGEGQAVDVVEIRCASTCAYNRTNTVKKVGQGKEGLGGRWVYVD